MPLNQTAKKIARSRPPRISGVVPKASLHDEPSDLDRQEDLERQYAKIQHDEYGAPLPITIFCPWCGAGNQPGKPSCCKPFVVGVDLIGQRQVESVVRQLREVRLGSRRTIKCPYCGRRVSKEASGSPRPADWPRPMRDPFCCDLMHDAALAIVEKMTYDGLAERKARIEEGMGRN